MYISIIYINNIIYIHVYPEYENQNIWGKSCPCIPHIPSILLFLHIDGKE